MRPQLNEHVLRRYHTNPSRVLETNSSVDSRRLHCSLLYCLIMITHAHNTPAVPVPVSVPPGRRRPSPSTFPSPIPLSLWSRSRRRCWRYGLLLHSCIGRLLWHSRIGRLLWRRVGELTLCRGHGVAVAVAFISGNGVKHRKKKTTGPLV